LPNHIFSGVVKNAVYVVSIQGTGGMAFIKPFCLNENLFWFLNFSASPDFQFMKCFKPELLREILSLGEGLKYFLAVPKFSQRFSDTRIH
jgi:hypothetical protein